MILNKTVNLERAGKVILRQVISAGQAFKVPKLQAEWSLDVKK